MRWKSPVQEAMTISIFIFTILGLFYGLDFILKDDIELRFDACDEYCFHWQEGSYPIGTYFNTTCICSNGESGWFPK